MRKICTALTVAVFVMGVALAGCTQNGNEGAAGEPANTMENAAE